MWPRSGRGPVFAFPTLSPASQRGCYPNWVSKNWNLLVIPFGHLLCKGLSSAMKCKMRDLVVTESQREQFWHILVQYIHTQTHTVRVINSGTVKITREIHSASSSQPWRSIIIYWLLSFFPPAPSPPSSLIPSFRLPRGKLKE